MTVLASRRRELTSVDLETTRLLDSNAQLLRPAELTVAVGIPIQHARWLVGVAQRLYTVWDTGDLTLLAHGDRVAACAVTSVRTAVPDLRCSILSLAVEPEGFSARLRFTGHFTGVRDGVHGRGQALDTSAFDVQLWPPTRAA
jgi:hypothetical protein